VDGASVNGQVAWSAQLFSGTCFAVTRLTRWFDRRDSAFSGTRFACLPTRSRFTFRTRPRYLISIKEFSFKHTGGQDGNLVQVKVWLRGSRPATKTTYYSDDKYRR
jgi:hypothetical protein